MTRITELRFQRLQQQRCPPVLSPALLRLSSIPLAAAAEPSRLPSRSQSPLCCMTSGRRLHLLYLPCFFTLSSFVWRLQTLGIKSSSQP